MSEKIKLYDTGDCVEVTVWGSMQDGFFQNRQVIGLVLEAELVEMDGTIDNYFDPTYEWMYRVALPSGEIAEAWDYEIRPVNVMGKEYNIISHQPKGA